MNKGFTLIETIVVIAILAVMATIVFSSISSSNPQILDGISISTAEAFYPEPDNYAVDVAGALTPEQLIDLNAKLKTMDSDKHQFGVVIVETTQPLSIEEYGIKLAEKWKVGYKGLDNGAIVILATKDRKVRIEVGYGLEGDINDAKAGRIIDNYIPSLKVGDWNSAIIGMVDELNKNIK